MSLSSRLTKVIASLLVVLLSPLPTLAQAVPQKVEYYALDALGSVRTVFAPNGQTLSQHDYAPFGEEVPPAAASLDIRFVNQERDPEFGFDYLGSRYYSPRVGRLTSVDPAIAVKASLRDPQRWNRYTYALNSPLRYHDPDGELLQFLVAVWAAFEFASTLYDIYSGGYAMVDYFGGGGSLSDVGWSAGSLAMGAVAPGPGSMYTRGAKEGIELARDLGKVEKLVDVAGNTKRIASATETAAYRVPDILIESEKRIGDVKNVSRLRESNQIKDIFSFAEKNDFSVEFWVRDPAGPLGGTRLSPSMQEKYKAGLFITKTIP